MPYQEKFTVCPVLYSCNTTGSENKMAFIEKYGVKMLHQRPQKCKNQLIWWKPYLRFDWALGTYSFHKIYWFWHFSNEAQAQAFQIHIWTFQILYIDDR